MSSDPHWNEKVVTLVVFRTSYIDIRVDRLIWNYRNSLHEIYFNIIGYNSLLQKPKKPNWMFLKGGIYYELQKVLDFWFWKITFLLLQILYKLLSKILCFLSKERNNLKEKCLSIV